MLELTGDTAEAADEAAVASADLTVTTPEKWDSFSRFRRDAQGVMGRVALLLLDEVHLLHDPKRGPALEAVVSRMKTLRTILESFARDAAKHDEAVQSAHEATSTAKSPHMLSRHAWPSIVAPTPRLSESKSYSA